MLFNIGDEVRIVAHSCGSTQVGGTNSNMSEHVGEVLEIRTIESRGGRVGYRLKGNRWLWDERLLELAVERGSSGKHQRVISKIKQMETRRKQLGYKTYQFVTGQEDKSGVQYKVDLTIPRASTNFGRVWSYADSSVEYTSYTAYELDF